jgi:hypothetical protein
MTQEPRYHGDVPHKKTASSLKHDSAARPRGNSFADREERRERTSLRSHQRTTWSMKSANQRSITGRFRPTRSLLHNEQSATQEDSGQSPKAIR